MGLPQEGGDGAGEMLVLELAPPNVVRGELDCEPEGSKQTGSERRLSAWGRRAQDEVGGTHSSEEVWPQNTGK